MVSEASKEKATCFRRAGTKLDTYHFCYTIPAIRFCLCSFWNRPFVGAMDEGLKLLLCVAWDVGRSWIVAWAGYDDFFHYNDVRFVPSARQAVAYHQVSTFVSHLDDQPPYSKSLRW